MVTVTNKAAISIGSDHQQCIYRGLPAGKKFISAWGGVCGNGGCAALTANQTQGGWPGIEGKGKPPFA